MISRLIFIPIVVAQIQPLLPSIQGSCLSRPPACVLNCAYGFVSGFGSSCLCLCQSNPCAPINYAPIKSSLAIQPIACVHLLSAIQRLPSRHLATGYVPTCHASGTFSPVQCDRSFCWCVNIETGHEIAGTKLKVEERAELNCAEPRDCPVSVNECLQRKIVCPFGLKTDENGCPSTDCECKNICEKVRCDRKFHECQLIEPDCGILNPCPNGPPATLPNGVTALCTDANPCYENHWCHQIGYNGLGFCCREPEAAARLTSTCEARAPRASNSSTECDSECRVDADCENPQRCCFDGCGLKFLLYSLGAECPKLPRSLTCEKECKDDNDCTGLRRCCKNGCSSVCAYPQKTTACLHDAITFDLNGWLHAPRCNSHGEYHEIQCDDERCYCAEPKAGSPIPHSIVPKRSSTGVPNICQGNPLSNDYSLIEQCNGTNCPHGFTCQSFGLPGSGGLCCPLGISSQGGVKPTVHSGQCPTQQIRLTSQLGCLIQCKADADCQQNEKCCFDSCGHKVASTTKSTRPGEKIGECRSLRNVNRNDCRSGVDDCQNDLECPGTQKCCSDGCYRRCMSSHRTTACLHLKTALEAFGRNVKCTSTGEFETTQCNNEFCWCTNVSGAEIEGTRVANSLIPDCRMRRVCAEQECTSRCANGYRKDANGCNTCECSTPCDDLKCQNDQFVCIANDVECLTSDCLQVPVCVPNLCPSGRPLSKHTCQSTTDCPHGSHCRLFGLTQAGYCCSGVGRCPNARDLGHSVCGKLRDNQYSECNGHLKCCFNGCARSCLPPQRATACVHLAAAVHALQLLGNRNSFTPACRSDGRFAQTQRFGLNEWCVDERGREVAGTRSNSGSPNCQHPRLCPALICRQQCELGFELNADGCEECACRDPCRSVNCPLDHVCRLVSPQECELGTCDPLPKFPESDLLLSATKCPATPQSLTDHRERKVECRWSRECAEDEGPCCFNGHGTSCSRSSGIKDLTAAVIAHQTKTGVQGLSPIKPINNEPTVTDTTTSACPVNRFQNPGCRTECRVDGPRKCAVQCSKEESECEHGIRLDRNGCPTNGVCECRNPCETFQCALSDEICVLRPVQCPQPPCPKQPTCRLSPCAARTLPLRTPHQVVETCRHETDCAAEAECRALATSDDENGYKVGVCCQVEIENTIKSTKKLKGICPLKVIDPTDCMHMMNAVEKLQNDGVPTRLSVPSCDNQIGRSRDCAEEVCLPVPICERNPCDRNERPAQEARGFSQFACLPNSTRPCPGGYQCTGFDERQIGICCPLSSPPTHSDDHNRMSTNLGRSSTFTRHVVCSHGEIYTRNREPVICSALGPNTCPSTHYCVTNSDERNGNCCPTKRFVCNLEQDIGNCNQPQTRFYYDSESQACLPFVFAGCNGSLNNFETETACSKFCIGVGQTLNDDTEQIYSLGFTLTGPLRRSKHTDAFNERLRDYLMATFQLDDSAIRDLYVKDDNTIRFNLMDEQAQLKSQNISKASFVRSRAAKDDRSAVFRGGTPTFGPLSGFVGIRRRADGQVERATSSTGSASTVEAVPATTQSADDVRRVRVPRQRGRAIHPTIVGHDPQAQRRSSSRTTLYY
ncbi:hypothetical protein M3Y94_00935300 [Aphelenchoides besseyi]|nr:hypothetical protein M3Y94_00935300 [Aphelenchoides besseyi]